METFIPKTFDIPELVGISAKNIEEHLKLYQGYVKNVNGITEKIMELSKESDLSADKAGKNAFVLGELFRRYSFEYNGMRNHEVYFASLSGGPKPLRDESPLKSAIAQNSGSFDEFLVNFKTLAMTRGVGWAVLWYDRKDDRLLATWVDEQHLGQLNGCEMILALDMWEHSYVADYQPSGKKKYIEDFFTNLNWSVIEENFNKAK